MPDRPETARLVWSTLIAVDHANRTGDYSVLRALGSPGFRQNNDPAALAEIFAPFRREDIGLRRVVLYPPAYAEPPTLLGDGSYRVLGSIPIRPEAILFDLTFEHVAGEWRLFGVRIGRDRPRAAAADREGTPEPEPKPDEAEAE